MKTEAAYSSVALFVKPPIPGFVKTRLAKEIGADEACRVYRIMAENTIRQVKAGALPLILFYDGDNESDLPELWRDQAAFCVPQRGDDLGTRMADAFRHLFSKGVSRVLLIGSDIPDLDESYLKNADEALDHYKIVIGPAKDGGYCLIGFNSESFDDSIFDEIPWSTGDVLELTIERCRHIGITPFLLEPLQDIDNANDLLEVMPELL